ncbi:stalk domain-containing protein [Bacillus solimangrovi]|uniref:GH18 domain-containing protein n=1 Tax=Bacillus solimangrovi TaxID=1305675 RepID=A0A1E5LFI6_9BACI|nr:stalk domain-containing protein [Bacillus solimangrovi]OEH92832.1 hypothetical protein BFG57_02220 [Bacillus solimangrovi]
MKRLIAFISILVFVLIPSIQTQAEANDQIKIYVNNEQIDFPTSPEISSENRTFVPFRVIAEAMDITVTWINSERKIVATSNGMQVELTIGEKQGYIDGQAYELDSAAYINNGHTLIPLRFFSEAFGANVQWNNETSTISIQSEEVNLYTMSFYGLGAFNYRNLVPKFDGMAYMWSSISNEGTLNIGIEDNDEDNYNEFFWPEDHPDATADEIIRSGVEIGNDGYLMVAALQMNRIKAFLDDQNKQDDAIEEMIDLVKEHQLTGVLLDFEEFDSSANVYKEKYTDFVKRLSTELNKINKELAIAVYPLNNYFNNYDYETLSTLADTIILMSYDYIPVGTTQPEPLNMVEEGLEQTLNFIPKDKLLLGINLVHETDETMIEKVNLAKRYKVKGVAFWLLNQVSSEEMEQIEQLTR